MKHAFLIIAHKNPNQLAFLLSLLDHPSVKLAVHWDRKAPLSIQERERIQKSVSRATLRFFSRYAVRWGGVSQIRCEFFLLSQALGQADYYHLLSGQDLPLRPVEDVLSYFDREPRKEYVQFDPTPLSEAVRERYRYYYPLQERAERHAPLDRLQWKLIALQKRLCLCRKRGDRSPYGKGSNWFSITQDLAEALCREEKALLRQFRMTRCCDELFLQTFFLRRFSSDRLARPMGDPFGNLRYVDWERGEPYVFTQEDLAPLFSSSCLFARKFDLEKDAALKEKYLLLLQQKNRDV